MKFDRYTGKSLEEALEKASKEKNTDVSELTYTVLEEKAGFLGIGKTVEIEVFCDDDIRQFLYDYIMTYFDNAELDGTCEVEQDPDGLWHIQVNCINNAILIGKAGRSLESFIRLVRAAASAQFKKRVRVTIDVNGYKQERYEKVARMAMRVAKDVRRTKVDAVLEPMPADERKAIHNALANMANITTKSEGEGSDRRLHILYSPNKETD